ncbi:DUF5110 domain-containing protein [Geofilum rubicundum]|nr:DUF5110 domain-containing protein [Geofilum rubicundum]
MYVPAGAVVPFGPEIEHTAQKTDAPYTIVVYTGKDGAFDWYEDEGTNYNYEQGDFSTIALSYNEAEQALTLGQREGSFEGMAENRQFRVIWVSPDAPFDFSLENLDKGKVYDYTGEELVIKR